MESILKTKKSNMGGSSKLLFVNITDINNFPERDPSTFKITTDIILNLNKVWSEIGVEKESIKYNNKTNSDTQSHSITADYSTNDETITRYFDLLVNKRFLVLRKDSNNTWMLIGTTKEPCTFSYEKLVGARASNYKGYSIQFNTQCTKPELLYTGFIETHEGVLQGSIPLVAPVIELGSVLTNSISVNWNNVASATHYLVDVATDNAFTQIVFEDIFVANNNYTINNLQSRIQYFVRVRASRGLTQGPNSNTLITTTDYHAETLVLSNRINADGGVIPDITRLNNYYKGLFAAGGQSLINSTRIDTLFSLPNYKRNGLNISRSYSTNVNGDLIQNTASRQPLLMAHADNERFIASYGNETHNANYSLSYPNEKQRGATTTISSSSNDLWEISIKFDTRFAGAIISLYQLNNNGLNICEFFWNGTAMVGNWHGGRTITPNITLNQKLWFRIRRTAGNNNEFAFSNDGITYSVVSTVVGSSATYSINTVSIGGFCLNSSGFSRAGARVYSAIGTNNTTPAASFTFNLSNYVETSNTWTAGSTTWTLLRPATTGLNTFIYTGAPICVSDGTDDKLVSNSFTNSTGISTTYTVIDFAVINTGTRYFINSGSDAFVLFTNGTNLFIGDGTNNINLGAMPTQRRMITFVKNGVNSFAQINQLTGTTGNGGTAQPSSLTLCGRTINDTQNAATCISGLFHYDGAHDAATRAAIQNTINSIMTNPLW